MSKKLSGWRVLAFVTTALSLPVCAQTGATAQESSLKLSTNLVLPVAAAKAGPASVSVAAPLPVPARAAVSNPALPSADLNAVRVLVLPAGDTTLASPVAGRILALPAALGKVFKKGDVLVSLDCEEPRARLVMAKADLAAATDQHEAKLRMQGLEQASDVEVALAASAVVKARAQIDLLQFQISQCTIRAPWDGQTAGLHVRNFMTISPGLPLLDLVRSGYLRLKLNVPSRWVSSLKEGLQFDVTIDETGKTYPARIHLINSRVDPVSQTIELEATLLNLHPGLLPGMSGISRFSGMR